MNEKNLQPFRKGEVRAREAGRAGGIASGEAKRERFRALLLAELDAEATKYVPPQKDELGLIPLFDEGHFEPAGYSVRAKLVKQLVAKAESGDLKALAMVMALAESDEDETESEAQSVKIA